MNFAVVIVCKGYVANFDITPYAMKQNTLQVLKEIEYKAGCLFRWFSTNYFNANPK